MEVAARGLRGDERWIDGLAGEQRVHHGRLGVTDAGVLDVDELVTIGLQRVAWGRRPVE